MNERTKTNNHIMFFRIISLVVLGTVIVLSACQSPAPKKMLIDEETLKNMRSSILQANPEKAAQASKDEIALSHKWPLSENTYIHLYRNGKFEAIWHPKEMIVGSWAIIAHPDFQELRMTGEKSSDGDAAILVKRYEILNIGDRVITIQDLQNRTGYTIKAAD